MKSNPRTSGSSLGTDSGRKFRRTHVLLVSTAHLVHDIYTGFLPPLLPLLVDRLGIGYTVAGLLSVLQRIPTLLNPLIGALAERFSPRRMIVGAILCTSLAMSALGMAPGPVALGGLLLVSGISAAVFHVPSPVLIRRLAGERLGLGMSLYMLGGEIARTLGPLVILAAVSLWGLAGTWRVVLFGLVMGIILSRGLGRAVEGLSSSGHGRVPGSPPGLKAVRFFLLVGGYLASRAGIKAALTIFLPVYMRRRGFSIWSAGISLSVLQFSGAVGTYCWGAWSDALGRHRTLVLTGILTPILMAAFSTFPGVIGWCCLSLLGFTLFAQGPVLLALVQDVGGRRPEFFNSIYMTVNFSVNALAVLFLGWGGDRLGMLTVVPFTAIPAAAAVFFAWRLRNYADDGI